MLVSINAKNPEADLISECAKLLERGEVIVCPTDTVYAYVCHSEKARAIEKLAKLKGVRMNRANLSLLCSDLSELSKYAKQVSTPDFRIMKSALPGPYTFILNASGLIPSLFKNKRRTVGIRVPNDAICLALTKEIGCALAATSVHSDDVQDHFSSAQDIFNEKLHMVAAVIDGGNRGLEGSSVIDLSKEEPIVIREGKGRIDIL